MISTQVIMLTLFDVIAIVIFAINTITLPIRLFTGNMGIENASINL